MSSSIARQVALRGTALLVGSLVVAGAGTAAVLHIEAIHAVDGMLLSAAQGHDTPEADEPWHADQGHHRVDAWEVRPGDPRLPADMLALALDTERPVFADLGDRRTVVVMTEEGDDEDHERHRLLAASTQRPTVARTIGPFLMAYTGFSALVALLAAFVLRATVRGSLAPLSRARDEAAGVLGLGEGKRLTSDAPVELQGLLVGFNALLDRLDAAHQAQGRFTAEAAHELRTPVTSLLGELDVVLRRERTADAYKEALLSARDEVGRLRRVVEGLTALARLDAGEVDHYRELIRAGEVANAAVYAERATLTAAGCTARVEVVDDPELDVHTALVGTALGNLVRNAARYAPGTQITLTVRQDGDHVLFDVDDRGPGVPAADREAVFDRFMRAGAARRSDPSGLGLGLPIARQIARRHGGDCVLLDAPGGGTRARLTLRVG